jgi:menaquinone-dependent protoporphyrinogen IX oxidase
MNGAIFFASRYSSTAQYAEWISEATGLPVFDVKDANADPSRYDFLILGSAVIYYKPIIHKWVKRNLARIGTKPIILFTVSGAPAGAKLDGWIADSLPQDFIANMKHVALRGRQNPKDLTLFDRMMLIIAGLKNPDRVAGQEELQGFDYMDKSSIAPVVGLAGGLQSAEAGRPAQVA